MNDICMYVRQVGWVRVKWDGWRIPLRRLRRRRRRRLLLLAAAGFSINLRVARCKWGRVPLTQVQTPLN